MWHGGFPAHRRMGERIADLGRFAADVSDGLVAISNGKNADDQIKIFNDLLKTVCAKLLIKIKELDRANGDLQNLMQVSAIPAIFVDENLLVRRFTVESSMLYSLSSRDIGQSLLDVACELDYCDLEKDFQCVAKTGETFMRHLRQRGDIALYLMRILPTHCRDSSFGGAALTFVRVNA
jgi:two-component system CheB/CheR fusion protein